MTEIIDTCPVCSAGLQHQLSKNSKQYFCGTTVNINSYHVGPDALKVQGLITGNCADKIAIKTGVKE